MKKIYLLSSILCSAFAMKAQLTQATHAPAAGDTYEMFTVNPSGVTPGASGMNAVWNFSNVTVNTAVRSSTASAASDPKFPSADVKVTASTGDTYFYDSNVSDLYYYGGKMTLPPVTADVTYTMPALMAVYPVTFNSPQISPTSGSINITQPTASSGVFEGSSSAVADGSGTLIVPGNLGTFTNTTRYHTTQVVNFTVNTFLGPVTGTLTQLTYEYFASGIKAPVFSIASSTANVPSLGPPTTQTIVTKNKNAVGINPPPPTNTTGISVYAPEAGYAVYPNPANTTLLIKGAQQDGSVVELSDVSGKMVMRETLSSQETSLDVSKLPAGLYFYKISRGKDVTIESGKVLIAH